MKFGHGEWLVGSVYYARKNDIPLAIIIPAVIIPMLLFIAVSVYCYRWDEDVAWKPAESFAFFFSPCVEDSCFFFSGGRVSRRSGSTRR